jgi:hypothetical protein
VTPFRNDAVLSPALSRRVDEGEDGLKKPIGSNTESDERCAREKGFDSNGIFVSKDKNSHADRDDGANDCDEQ